MHGTSQERHDRLQKDLLNRKSVHICAKKYSFTRPILKNADETRTADICLHFVCVEASEMLGYCSGGLVFLKGKLGVGVEVLVECLVGGQVRNGGQ